MFNFSKKRNTEKGFTLIELLVSIALFTIFLVAILGAIFTIVDANKKSRSMVTVMNNLNFAVDSITRSFKTGINPSGTSGDDCVTVTRVDYQETTGASDISRETVRYCYVSSGSNSSGDYGKITRQIGGTTVDLTSPDTDIKFLTFKLFNTDSRTQPKLLINMEGEVKVSPTISSAFTIQTAVSQRRLNI